MTRCEPGNLFSNMMLVTLAQDCWFVEFELIESMRRVISSIWHQFESFSWPINHSIDLRKICQLYVGDGLYPQHLCSARSHIINTFIFCRIFARENGFSVYFLSSQRLWFVGETSEKFSREMDYDFIMTSIVICYIRLVFSAD